VHELLHVFFQIMDYSGRGLMRAHLGDYERAESTLKAKAAMLSSRQRRES
jgi:hypothetical protein